MISMISPEEAKSKVLERSKPLEIRHVSLDEAQGYVVAEDIVAREPVPAYRATVKDVGLRMVEEQVGVRENGSDIKLGNILMKKGEYIGASEIALLAAVGRVTQIPVFRKPIVAIVSIGSEMEEPTADDLPTGEIRDVSRVMLKAAVREAWGSHPSVIMDLGIVGDCETQIEGAMNEAISGGADIMITTRGGPMGNKDFLNHILSRRGTVHFGQVSMEPGNSCTFATISKGKDQVVFGLPSNPISALTTFHLLVYPCIQRLSGFPEDRIEIWAKAAASFPVPMDLTRTSYKPVCVEFEPESSETSIGRIAAYDNVELDESSLLMMNYHNANALMVVPSQVEHQSKLMGNGQPMSFLPAGTILPVIMLPSKRILGRQSR